MTTHVLEWEIRKKYTINLFIYLRFLHGFVYFTKIFRIYYIKKKKNSIINEIVVYKLLQADVGKMYNQFFMVIKTTYVNKSK